METEIRGPRVPAAASRTGGKSKRRERREATARDSVKNALPSRPAVRTMEPIVSCHSVWFFDTERMRFRRLPRDVKADTPALDHDWTPYYGLEIDVSSGAFLVSLNKEQTRFLRSWRHDSPCSHCGRSTSAVARDGQQSTAPRRLAPT